MSCEELGGYYELYALGVLDENEREEIRTHVNRGCEACTAGIKQARKLMALVGAAAEPATPSPNLRRRIVASVSPERKRFPWAPVWAAVAALSLLAVVYGTLQERRLRTETERLRAETSGQAAAIARLNDAFAILNAPGTREVSFGQGQPQPPRGKVFVNAGRGVLLVASNLPPAPAGKIYEMWLIPKGGKPVPAGLFQGASGTALHVLAGPIDVNATGAVAVTLENQGGAAQPTSQPLIVAPLAPAA